MKVKLSEVINNLEMVSPEMDAHYDPQENEFFWTGDYAENSYLGLNDDQFEEKLERSISLPSSFDIHEYQIMREFIDTIEDERIHNQLLHSIKGKGAFGRFKDTCYDLRVINDWYEFRHSRYEEIAIAWCKRHQIEYETDKALVNNEQNDLIDEKPVISEEYMKILIDAQREAFLQLKETPLMKAYEYLELAHSAETEKDAIKYAKKALKVYPEFIDARLFLLRFEDNFFKEEATLIDIIEKEKASLEQEGYFDQRNIGHFYGILETRSYIRALHRLAWLYADDGKIQSAINICNEILKLNESDNMGARFLLMALYAYTENEELLKSLYKTYKFECLQTLVPFMILYYKQADYKQAKKYLRKIDKVNKYFKQAFTLQMNYETKIPEGYYSMGDPTEAVMYIENYEFLLNSVEHIFEFIISNIKSER